MLGARLSCVIKYGQYLRITSYYVGLLIYMLHITRVMGLQKNVFDVEPSFWIAWLAGC